MENEQPKRLTKRRIIFVVGFLCLVIIIAIAAVFVRQKEPVTSPVQTEEDVPATITIWASVFADTEARKARELTFQGKPDEAIALLDGHLASTTLTDQERAWLVNAKGDVFSLKGDLAGSLEFYLSAIEYAPGIPAPYASAAYTYGTLGDKVKALEYAQLALQKYDQWDGSRGEDFERGRASYEDIVEIWQ